MKINKVRRAILLSHLAIICIICVESDLAAQSKVRGNQPKPNNCEEAQLYLDNSATEASKDEEGNVIAIARLGNDELSPSLNQRRLEFVRSYLINQRFFNRIVIASGERVQGSGRVELYVGGKLLYVLRYPRRGHISCVGLG
jgi:hypothetical protein